MQSLRKVKENAAVVVSVREIKRCQQRQQKVCILQHISINTATALKDLGYKLSPRLMDKNEEFYYKVYLV